MPEPKNLNNLKHMIAEIKTDNTYDPNGDAMPVMNYEEMVCDDQGDFMLVGEPHDNADGNDMCDKAEYLNSVSHKINFEWKMDVAPIGAAPAPMVGHLIENQNPYIQQHFHEDDAHLGPEPGVQFNSYSGVVGGNHGKNSYYHPKSMPKLKVQYDGDEDECCGESVGYAETVSATRGLMVFYINTNGLGAGQALDMIDKVKSQYGKVEKRLREDHIEVMWLPTGAGESSANYFSFR